MIWPLPWRIPKGHSPPGTIGYSFDILPVICTWWGVELLYHRLMLPVTPGEVGWPISCPHAHCVFHRTFPRVGGGRAVVRSRLSLTWHCDYLEAKTLNSFLGVFQVVCLFGTLPSLIVDSSVSIAGDSIFTKVTLVFSLRHFCLQLTINVLDQWFSFFGLWLCAYGSDIWCRFLFHLLIRCLVSVNLQMFFDFGCAHFIDI